MGPFQVSAASHHTVCCEDEGNFRAERAMDIHVAPSTAPTSRWVPSLVGQVLGCDAVSHVGSTPSPKRTGASERGGQESQKDGARHVNHRQIWTVSWVR